MNEESLRAVKKFKKVFFRYHAWELHNGDQNERRQRWFKRSKAKMIKVFSIFSIIFRVPIYLGKIRCQLFSVV